MIFDDSLSEAPPEDELSFSLAGAESRHAVSPEIFSTSSKNHDHLLRGLERVGQREMARAMCVTDSTISRLKDETHRLGSPLARTARMLAVMGYKLVPVNAKCFIELDD